MATQKFTVNISGMHCASCVSKVEKALNNVSGIEQASVNLASQSARLKTQREDAKLFDELSFAVEKAGYQLLKQDIDPQIQQANDYRRLKRDLNIAALLSMPVVIIEMGGHLIPAWHQWLNATLGQQGNWILQFVLTTAVLFGPGLRFFHIGVPALMRAAPEMNALVALGTFAAWSYSSIATFMPSLLPAGSVNVYFEAAAVIVTLILLGRLLEARAKGRSNQAIRRLLDLQVKTARRLIGGQPEDVPVELVKAGDILLVRPGEKIPLDGEIIEGKAYV
ncbi:MAG: heavy metal translocating P-type ATPase, partial [Methylophaga sp.]|nr:heavy metal translocating P-type ATPase [Methylophaga sp.]